MIVIQLIIKRHLSKLHYVELFYLLNYLVYRRLFESIIVKCRNLAINRFANKITTINNMQLRLLYFYFVNDFNGTYGSVRLQIIVNLLKEIFKLWFTE